MKTIVCELEGTSPLSWGKYYQVEKKEGESAAAFEERTWKERCHVDSQDNLLITPMAVKNCLTNIAGYLSEKIEGEGNKKWGKKFESGLMVLDPIILYHNGNGDGNTPIKKDEVTGEWLFVPADGRRGGSTRVPKCFPKIESWKGTAKIIVMDEKIDLKTFERHLRAAGNLIGFLRFRPAKNGYYGRFKVNAIKVEEE